MAKSLQKVRRQHAQLKRRRIAQAQAREWLRTTEALVIDGLVRVTEAALQSEDDMLRAVDDLAVWLRAYGRAVRWCAELGVEVELHQLAREALADLQAQTGQVGTGG
nr:MAG: hypothetical protein DIU70_01895 [Bacillota bacterium]